MTSSEDEARKLVQDALDALRQWRNEIDAVNARCLTRAMDSMAAAQQALGWPNRVTTDTGPSAVLPGKMHYFMVLDAVREQLLKSSQEDMRVIDKVAEACYASLLPQNTGSPQRSISPPKVLDEAAPATSTKSRTAILAGMLFAVGAIGYVIYDGRTKATTPIVDSEKHIEAATTQKSVESIPPVTPSTPPPSAPSADVTKKGEEAPASQATVTPEPPVQRSALKTTVELGALSSQQQATRKWGELQRRAADVLADHAPVVVKAKRGRGVVWLLEIRDFAERSDAIDLCERLRRKGVRCDVR
jgi:hypothetical protein